MIPLYPPLHSGCSVLATSLFFCSVQAVAYTANNVHGLPLSNIDCLVGGWASDVSALKTACFVACLSATVSLFSVFTLIFFLSGSLLQLSDISTRLNLSKQCFYTGNKLDDSHRDHLFRSYLCLIRTVVWGHFGSAQTEKSRSLDQTTRVWKHQQSEWTNCVKPCASLNNSLLLTKKKQYFQQGDRITRKQNASFSANNG